MPAPSHAPPPRDAQRELVGGALMLLFAVLGGLVLAAVLRGFQNLLYVPFLMPAFLGWVIGTGLARIRLRFLVLPRGPVVSAAVIGALVGYGAYHVVCYVGLMDYLVAELTTFEDAIASDPAREVQRFLESHTGEQGFAAYLAFVGMPINAPASPLGALSRLGLTSTSMMVAIAAEAVVATGAAVAVALVRSRAVSGAGAGAPLASSGPRRRVREIVARVDASTLADAMEAIEAGSIEAAARLLRTTAIDAAFVVAIVHDPFSSDPHVLEVHATTTSGDLGALRVRRELTSWDGQALMDGVRISDAETDDVT